MSAQVIVFIGVVVYLIMMLVVAVLAAKQLDPSENFMVAGRLMVIWVCAVTLVATWFGHSTMIGASAATYEGGLLRIIAGSFGGALALFVVGFFFAGIFCGLRLVTFIEFLTTGGVFRWQPLPPTLTPRVLCVDWKRL